MNNEPDFDSYIHAQAERHMSEGVDPDSTQITVSLERGAFEYELEVWFGDYDAKIISIRQKSKSVGGTGRDLPLPKNRTLVLTDKEMESFRDIAIEKAIDQYNQRWEDEQETRAELRREREMER